MDRVFRKYLSVIFCKRCKFLCVKVMINKYYYIAISIDDCAKFVFFTIGANFHATNICGAYSNV